MLLLLLLISCSLFNVLFMMVCLLLFGVCVVRVVGVVVFVFCFLLV